jgi:hypothetical protein
VWRFSYGGEAFCASGLSKADWALGVTSAIRSTGMHRIQSSLFSVPEPQIKIRDAASNQLILMAISGRALVWTTPYRHNAFRREIR